MKLEWRRVVNGSSESTTDFTDKNFAYSPEKENLLSPAFAKATAGRLPSPPQVCGREGDAVAGRSIRNGALGEVALPRRRQNPSFSSFPLCKRFPSKSE
jgi:hypothetical protein